MIGFWFGIGVILAVKMVNSLDYCIEELKAENKVTANKIAEENQIQQVATKGTKKAKVGKRLAEYNRRKREELPQMKAQKVKVKLSERIIVLKPS